MSQRRRDERDRSRKETAMTRMNRNAPLRAQGCLMGQLAGDSLGSLVEFKTPEEIRRLYPEGVRDLADGGVWNTLAGQPTDDSEMALALARSLAERGRYDRKAVQAAYLDWFGSNTFGCGRTVTQALRDGFRNPESQANGALMRVSPLGIFGANDDVSPEELAAWADQDAALTHVHPVCRQANILFVEALARAIRHGAAPDEIHGAMLSRAGELRVERSLAEALRDAAHAPPPDYLEHRGWVIVAFHNAVWQLLHAPNPEEGIIDTVMRGGDTDTNAAIAGALLGAVYGYSALPARWSKVILDCRPDAGIAGAAHPRPRRFWPTDARDLAARLVLSQEILECLWVGLTPLAEDKPFSVRYFDIERCPERYRRTLFELDLVERDAEFDVYFPTTVGKLALEHWPRPRRDEDLRIGPLLPGR
jgi:ADP-ribosylglycohydrolase